jgi:hypothetical protein
MILVGLIKNIAYSIGFQPKKLYLCSQRKKQDYENRNYRGNGQGAAPAPGGLQE